MKIDVKSKDKNKKAFIRVCLAYNGYLYLEYYTACGKLKSFLYEDEKGIRNENNLKMPAYILPLVKKANKIINELGGN